MVRQWLGDSQAGWPKFQATVRRCRQPFLNGSLVVVEHGIPMRP
jgi:hypothetical protein